MSTPADRGVLGNPEQAPLNKEAVEKFARTMADDIVRSLQVEIEDSGGFISESQGRNPNLQSQESRNQISPAISQSGLPTLGSLDYPDAPPPTPLLPELEKSRQSFSRKLKGGLAKEFAPSPPPPTPRETQEGGHRFEAEVELVEHLMRSLSTERPGGGDPGKMAEFAEGICRDIMKRVETEVGERCSLEFLAEQMARAIVRCSLEEARNV